jgi:LuxR family maltose regulon positive regulatory protein
MLSKVTNLLSTKLKRPSPRSGYIIRNKLFNKLDNYLTKSVIYIKGGAGTGKTTVLSSYIEERHIKNVAWLSLDELDNNIRTFWLYFIASVSKVIKYDNDFIELAQSNIDNLNIDNTIVMLINQISSKKDYIFVLDDIHYLNDKDLLKTIDFFIKSMPDNCHIIMLSREDATISLGFLAISDRLTIISDDDLILSKNESIDFLKNTLKLDIETSKIKQLSDYAEGWIGGLQLAAAAGIGDTNNQQTKLLKTNYLTEEIFKSLTDREQDFLVTTGYLSYFSSAICQKIISHLSLKDFDTIVESLIKKNLFIICLDKKNKIYRYHNILSEYLIDLVDNLEADKRTLLFQNSIKAFQEENDLDEAIRISYIANDFDNMMKLAKSMGGSSTAWTYLDKIPMDKLIKDIDLAAQCFIYDFSNLNVQHCRQLYNEFGKRYKDTKVFKIMKFAELYIDNDDNVLPQYNILDFEQIESLPVGTITKAMILIENSAALTRTMQYSKAKSCINRALEINNHKNIYIDFFAYNQIAQVYEDAGYLNACFDYYKKSESLLSSPFLMTATGTNFYFGLTGVCMRQMSLSKANELLQKARKLLEKQNLKINVANITLDYHLAEMEFLSGNNNGGAVLVDKIISKYPVFSVLTLGRLIQELDCANRLPAHLKNDFLNEFSKYPEYKNEPFMKLLHARILFKDGSKELAYKEADDIAIKSRSNHGKLHLVEANLLKIFMFIYEKQKENKADEIKVLLVESIISAYQDQIISPFYLDRSIIKPLLEELISSKEITSLNESQIDFIKKVINICNQHFVINKKEELSDREVQVLNKIAEGFTNQNIADQLGISKATVKTHVLSIFNKLNVSSRLVAVSEGKKRKIIN